MAYGPPPENRFPDGWVPASGDWGRPPGPAAPWGRGPERPSSVKVGGILGMIGAGINLAITGPIGLFLVITGFSSLGKTTVDDSAGWGQFFFVGCILLVLSLGHVLAVVALAMARAGRNGARVLTTVLAVPAALVLVAALCGSVGVTASQNVPGSGLSISWLMREIVMLVPTSLYVVGSFMLLSPAASAWYRARKAPAPWAAPVTWGPQYGMPPSHGTTGQNPRQREGRRNDRW